MKKIICTAMCIVSALTFCACTEAKNPEISDIAASVNATSAYAMVDLIEITEDKMDIYFTGLDMSKVESFYAAKAQDGYTDHFVAIKVSDGEYASEVVTILEDYKANLAETYADYAPIEAERAETGTVITINDDYVFMIISEDTATVTSAVETHF